ncbi:hypothetical protein LNAOJCKE_5355 [Methylorubrum aminovorans]|uniref:Transposase n=1 Tax=Methylorubrum aminovorans TaxID=269069 RepID=A0ABQ4ULP7_9HYPH|nr:hypothetical protein [Methylorubrum aminovorans]GJE68119.1 hypothetical protein LNAOJCKE_5355 [Methylorubrum aminovorans]GMA74008.1 hypothetical protein GCM10025880_04250 [Methylorubrum aminovorans]
MRIFGRHDLVEEQTGARATIQAAVSAWMGEQERAPAATHLLIAKSNAVVRALNTEIRVRWRASGRLS